MKKIKRKVYKTKLRPTIFKQTHKEYKKMVQMAKKETDGNLSLLIRTKVLGDKSFKGVHAKYAAKRAKRLGL